MKKIILLCAAFSLFLIGNVFAQNGTALEFDGTNDYVNLGADAGDGIRTMEMWFMLQECHNSTSSNVQTLICRDDLQNNHEFSIILANSIVGGGSANAGRLVFTYTDYIYHPIMVASNSNSWEPFRWYHVAVVIHPTDGLTLFIDGVKQSATNNGWTAPVTSSNNNTLLGSWLPGTSASRHFKGLLDDVHLSTAAEYTSNFTPPCTDRSIGTSTQALYLFNSGSGTVAIDETSNNNGTLVNYTTPTNDFWIHDYPCYDFSVHFMEGTQSSINLGDDLGGDIRSIEMFFKLRTDIAAISTYQYTLIARDDPAQRHVFALGFYDMYPNRLTFTMSDANGNFSTLLSNSGTWNTGTWYHVAIVIDPSNGTTMYIDGAADATNASMTSAIIETYGNNDIALGNWGANVASLKSASAAIDRVVISNDMLHTSSFNSCNGQVVACGKNILAYYRFNDKILNTFSDLSGNNYHGVPTAPSDMFIYGGNTCNQARLSRPITQHNESINIYPNPASTHITIECAEGIDGIFHLYSVSGQLVSTYQTTAETNINLLDVSKLENGIYFLVIKSTDGRLNEVNKIVIHK